LGRRIAAIAAEAGRAAIAIGAMTIVAAILFDWHRHRQRVAPIGLNLNTTEPIATQFALASAGGLLAALLRALAIGLAAGVAAWTVIRQPPQPIAGLLPVWGAGVAAALFAAGVGAVLERFAPQTVPLWPAFAVESLALPALGAAFAGARILAVVSVGLFVLCFLERLTASWQRRGALASLLLVAAVAAASFVGAQDPIAAAVDGVVTGVATVAIVYGLLRFDATALPAFLATGAILQIVEDALRKQAPAAFGHAVLAAAFVIVVTWAVMRYLARARIVATGG
jgi:hypothetical protein